MAGVTVGGIAVHGTPLSKRLEAEAQALERRAVELEQTPAADFGQAEGFELADLLAAIRDPLVIAPKSAEIVQWFAEASERALADYRKSHAGDSPASMTYFIEWAHGKLTHANTIGHDPCRVETPPDFERSYGNPQSTF